MKTGVINNTNFNAQKFRLPVRFVKPNSTASTARQFFPRKNLISGNFVKEYSNPNAELFFNLALETSNFDKKMYYLEQMGEYKLIDISLEQQVDCFIKTFDKSF